MARSGNWGSLPFGDAPFGLDARLLRGRLREIEFGGAAGLFGAIDHVGEARALRFIGGELGCVGALGSESPPITPS